MTKPFSRFDPVADRTFALRSFNRAETEINEHFWSFQVISDWAAYQATQANKTNPATLTSTVFSATGPDSLRIPETVGEWLKARTELENWLQTSALVSASAYLESYLRQACRSALMSDPLARFGAPRSLDGVSLVKKGIELPIEDQIRSVTSGEWSSRTEALRKLFGSVPKSLSDNISDLEAIRKLRNDYAHGFGRSLSIPLPSSGVYVPAQRLSRKTFLRYLGLISKVAAGIDKILLVNSIGNFELIHFYHQWKNEPNVGRNRLQSEGKRFKAALHKVNSVSVSAAYADDLIAYYQSA